MKPNNDLVFKIVTKYCGYNPGAISFFMDSISKYPDIALTAFDRMLINNIREDKLYILWNDCCDRDIKKSLDIMLSNSISDIIEHIDYENGRGIKYE